MLRERHPKGLEIGHAMSCPLFSALVIAKTARQPRALATRGQTPLHLAANDGYPDVVKVLLDAGADKAQGDRDQPEMPWS